MEYRVEWSTKAQKDVDGLDQMVARRILKKLNWYLAQPDPLAFARILEHPHTREARFRVGDYRAVVVIHYKKKVIIVVAVGHRGDIYR